MLELISSRFMIGLPVALAGMLVSRWLGDRAFHQLSGGEKTTVLESCAVRPGRGLLLPLVMTLYSPHPLLFCLMAGAYVLPVTLWSAHKLVQRRVSRAYVRAYLGAYATELAGITAFYLVVVQQLWAPRL